MAVSLPGSKGQHRPSTPKRPAHRRRRRGPARAVRRHAQSRGPPQERARVPPPGPGQPTRSEGHRRRQGRQGSASRGSGNRDSACEGSRQKRQRRQSRQQSPEGTSSISDNRDGSRQKRKRRSRHRSRARRTRWISHLMSRLDSRLSLVRGAEAGARAGAGPAAPGQRQRRASTDAHAAIAEGSSARGAWPWAGVSPGSDSLLIF